MIFSLKHSINISQKFTCCRRTSGGCLQKILLTKNLFYQKLTPCPHIIIFFASNHFCGKIFWQSKLEKKVIGQILGYIRSNDIRNGRTQNLSNEKNLTKIIKIKNLTKIIKIKTVFLFKTTLNSYNIILKKLLLASCTLVFLLEASPTSNVRNTEVVRINFQPPFVKIFRRKGLSRLIPYYHNSISTQRIMLSGDIKLTPGPENPKKCRKRKPQRK